MKATVQSVRFDRCTMSVSLSDGGILVVPLAWFPRLRKATPAQLENYELSRAGIHWEALDEDLSIEGLLAWFDDITTPPTQVRSANH
jgi:hypothetical protein